MSALKEILTNSNTLAKDYASREVELIELKLFHHVAAYTTSTVNRLLLAVIILMTTGFASIALALVLGQLFDSYVYGFLSVSGVYLLLALIAYLLRGRIEKLIINDLTQQFYSK